MIVDASEISKLDAYKGAALEALANQSASLQNFIDMSKSCNFFVSEDYNPASIYNPSYQSGDLKIEISRWFLKGYSVGYIAGMLCHEVGAHFLTDDLMHSIEHDQEKAIIAKNIKVKDAATDWSYTPSKAEQPDHIFASCYGEKRYTHYRRLMIEFATLIANCVNVPFSGKILFTNKDLTDLIDCWLMDVASILATKDKRARGVMPPYTSYVATAHGMHLAKLQADAASLTNNASVLQAIANATAKSTSNVLGEYGSMSKKIFAKK